MYHLDRQAIDKTIQTFAYRNDAMRKEVKRQLGLNKRIFLIMGASHALKLRLPSPFDQLNPEKVQKTFRKHPFVILLSEKTAKEHKARQLNPGLASLPYAD